MLQRRRAERERRADALDAEARGYAVQLLTAGAGSQQRQQQVEELMARLHGLAEKLRAPEHAPPEPQSAAQLAVLAGRHLPPRRSDGGG